ncbi:MAG: hypothetical protein Q9219_006236 [cf. Caloplaca sp. 3 TL-2023]
MPPSPVRFMYFNHMIVLDKDHRPVRAFAELNLTLSSRVEGFRLEAISRLNPNITARDMLARMPPETTTTIAEGSVPTYRPQCKPNALSMRRREFRAKYGLVSWTPREGSDLVKSYLDSLMGPELVVRNSTLEMRPLTADEVDRVLHLTRRSTHQNLPSPKPAASVAGALENTVTGRPPKPQGVEASVPDHPVNPSQVEHGEHGSELAVKIEDQLMPINPNEIDDEASYVSEHVSGVEFNVDDPEDCRYHLPQGTSERSALLHAIRRSINHYNALLIADLKVEAPAFHYESYETQWLAIQEALEQGWLAQGHDLEDCPELFRLPRWEGSMWSWVKFLQIEDH